MSIKQIVKIDSAEMEQIALDMFTKVDSVNEWCDGTPAKDFTPSKDAKSFKCFPYFLIIDSDYDLSWAENKEELIARLQEEIDYE